MDDILLYRKSIKNFEAAKILGYSSLATIPVGVLLIVNNSQDGFFSAEEGFLGTSDYVGSVLIGLMPILGTTGLIIHANAKRSRKELIDSFNSNSNFRDGSAFGIQLIPAQQGLGLGLRVLF